MKLSQARNQDFFRTGEFLLELGHFDKKSPTTPERKAPQGKKSPVFLPGNSHKFSFKWEIVPINDLN